MGDDSRSVKSTNISELPTSVEDPRLKRGKIFINALNEIRPDMSDKEALDAFNQIGIEISRVRRRNKINSFILSELGLDIDNKTFERFELLPKHRQEKVLSLMDQNFQLTRSVNTKKNVILIPRYPGIKEVFFNLEDSYTRYNITNNRQVQ